MKKIEEQPELHEKLPAKFLPFMNTKFLDKYFPICYLNVLAINQILQNCFTHHIYPQHVDTNDFKGKSKFTTLDNTYDPFTICLLTFLYPDQARVYEHYICGQILFNTLFNWKGHFTTSRKVFQASYTTLTCRHWWLPMQIKINNTGWYLWSVYNLFSYIYISRECMIFAMFK